MVDAILFCNFQHKFWSFLLEFIATLSAPLSNAFLISLKPVNPPPTVMGIKIFFEASFTILKTLDLSYKLATLSIKLFRLPHHYSIV